jgi:serine protease Do
MKRLGQRAGVPSWPPGRQRARRLPAAALWLGVAVALVAGGPAVATAQQQIDAAPPASAAAPAPAPAPVAAPAQVDRSQLIQSLLPSVVSIVIRKDVGGGGTKPGAAAAQPETRQAYGSGMIIDPSGLIATNYHVVQGAWEIEVGFHDGTRALAHLVKATKLIDVALIKVDVEHKLPAVRWGSSEALQVGEPVFAIGNALGVGISATQGIVSALHRNIDASPYDDFIQTDASINHGNSGGPLFNAQGEVVGMNTALLSPSAGSSGLGFAIPSRSVQIIIDRLLTYGWLRPGWIGVKIEEVTPDMARALGMRQAEGSIVAFVQPGGPAEQAGLRIGDVLVGLNEASASDERALLRSIATSPIGKVLALSLWRNGKPATVNVTVHEWPRDLWDKLDPPIPPARPEPSLPPDLGIGLAALTPADRSRPGLMPKQTAVKVVAVAAGSDAAQRGLTAGDFILRVQDRTIARVADVQAAFRAERASGLKFVMVLVLPKVQRFPGPEWLVLRLADG